MRSSSLANILPSLVPNNGLDAAFEGTNAAAAVGGTGYRALTVRSATDPYPVQGHRYGLDDGGGGGEEGIGSSGGTPSGASTDVLDIYVIYRYTSANEVLVDEVVEDIVARVRLLVARTLVHLGLSSDVDSLIPRIIPIVTTGSGLIPLHDWKYGSGQYTVDRFLRALHCHETETVVLVGPSVANVMSVRHIASSLGSSGRIVRLRSSDETSSENEILDAPALVKVLDSIIAHFGDLENPAVPDLQSLARLLSKSANIQARIASLKTPEADAANGIFEAFLMRRTQGSFKQLLESHHEYERLFIGGAEDKLIQWANLGASILSSTALEKAFARDAAHELSPRDEVDAVCQAVAEELSDLSYSFWFAASNGPCCNNACKAEKSQSWHRSPDGPLCRQWFTLWRHQYVLWAPGLDTCLHCGRSVKEGKRRNSMVRSYTDSGDAICRTCASYVEHKSQPPPIGWSPMCEVDGCSAEGKVWRDSRIRCFNDHAFFDAYGTDEHPNNQECSAPGCKVLVQAADSDLCPGCTRIFNTHSYVPSNACAFCGSLFADLEKGTRNTIVRFKVAACDRCYHLVGVKANKKGFGTSTITEARAVVQDVVKRHAKQEAKKAKINPGPLIAGKKKSSVDICSLNPYDALVLSVKAFLESRGSLSWKMKKPETLIKRLQKSGYSVESVVFWDETGREDYIPIDEHDPCLHGYREEEAHFAAVGNAFEQPGVGSSNDRWSSDDKEDSSDDIEDQDEAGDGSPEEEDDDEDGDEDEADKQKGNYYDDNDKVDEEWFGEGDSQSGEMEYMRSNADDNNLYAL